MHLNAIKLIISIAIFGLIDNILAKRAIFKTGNCSYNRKVFSNFTLQIPNGIIKMDMVLVSALVLGLKGHLKFEFRTSRSKSYQNVFELDINYCSLLNNTQNTISRRWYLSMLKKGNFATSCPISPGYYYLSGWKLDGNLVPSFLFLGEYLITGTFYYGKYKRNNDDPLLECTVEAVLIK